MVHIMAVVITAADDHPTQQDEALRRAREADKRRTGGAR
jgi:hypothetical protein